MPRSFLEGFARGYFHIDMRFHDDERQRAREAGCSLIPAATASFVGQMRDAVDAYQRL